MVIIDNIDILDKLYIKDSFYIIYDIFLYYKYIQVYKAIVLYQSFGNFFYPSNKVTNYFINSKELLNISIINL